MDIQVTSNDKFACYVAQRIAQQVLSRPNSVLCFATGNTTKPVFGELIRIKKELDIDFSRVFVLNVDEYVGVSADDPASCYWRIKRDLYDPLGINDGQFYAPSADMINAEDECRLFSDMLVKIGGIDMLLLSVGSNGHIAFNEPGAPFNSDIRIVKISEDTIQAKKDMFGGAELVPRYGITMGIRTIMNVRKILLIANGEHKAAIMKTALYEPVTTDAPVSILQLHPFVEVILDESAAGQ